LYTMTKLLFLNEVCLRQMMLTLPMMTTSPHFMANIASLRNEVK